LGEKKETGQGEGTDRRWERDLGGRESGGSGTSSLKEGRGGKGGGGNGGWHCRSGSGLEKVGWKKEKWRSGGNAPGVFVTTPKKI